MCSRNFRSWNNVANLQMQKWGINIIEVNGGRQEWSDTVVMLKKKMKETNYKNFDVNSGSEITIKTSQVKCE